MKPKRRGDSGGDYLIKNNMTKEEQMMEFLEKAHAMAKELLEAKTETRSPLYSIDYLEAYLYHEERQKDETKSEEVREYSLRVIDIHNHFNTRHEGTLHRYLIPKIEIADKFVEFDTKNDDH